MDVLGLFKKKRTDSISKKKRTESNSLINNVYYKNVYIDIKEADIDPQEHFMEYGWHEGRNPSFMFDNNFYTQNQNLSKNVNALLHYLLNFTDDRINPHAEFFTQYYLSQVEEDISISPLEHFYTVGIKKGLKPNPNFSFRDIKKRETGEFIPISLNSRTVAHDAIDDPDDFKTQLSRLDKDIPVFICMTHEASLTGAPLIILKIGEYLKSEHGFQVINFIGFDGKISDEFKLIGPTASMIRWHPDGNVDALKELKYYIDLIDNENLKLVGAYINSAESRNAITSFKELGIPVYALLHEMAYLYYEKAFQVIADNADKIIFPSQIVQNYAVASCEFEEEKIILRGQGLLKPELLNIDKQKAKEKLIEELGIPEDAYIVLGCGSLVMRKGSDLFCQTAFDVLRRENAEKVYFVWLGGKHVFAHDSFDWIFRDINMLHLEDRILFVGEKDDTSHYFCGADLFFLTSRADPFPCVIHEAMAASLPIVVFEDAGGAQEALSEGAGIVVPYVSTIAAANIIYDCFLNPDKGAEYGKNAKIRILEKYQYTDYVKFLVEDLVTSSYNKEEIIQLGLEDYSFEPDTRKKVVFTFPTWNISGVNTFVEELIEKLNLAGFDAEVLFTTQHDRHIDEKYLPNAPYKFLNRDYGDNHGIWSDLEQYLTENAPCVFVPSYDYIASAISPRLPDNVGILGVLHSDDMEHYEHTYRLGRYWNKIISVSKTIEKKLLEINPQFEDKSDVIYYGIEDKQGMPMPQKSDIFTLVYTGRISVFQKNILDYKKVLTLLKEKATQPFVFKFIGDGVDMEEFQKEMKPFVEEGIVQLLGRIPRADIDQELTDAHVFSLISDFEGLSVSMLEALSFYCVPVLTDIESGVSEIIKHDFNGLISPMRDYDKYTELIIQVMENKSLFERLAIEAKNTIKNEQLLNSVMAKKYKTVIEEILFELKGNKYHRPKMLTHNPALDGVLLPPSLQNI